MQKLTFIITITCFVLLPSLASGHEPQTNHSADLRTIAVDYDKGCQWKAKTVKWVILKKEPASDSFRFELEGFIIHIPGGASRFVLSSEGYLFVAYPDKSVLSFAAKLIPDNIRLSILGHSETKISNAELADILFMKTHCDKTPTNERDAQIWNYALVQKLAYFEDAQNVTKTESGKLTYYLSDNAAPPVMSGRAVITNNNREHNILLVSAYHMTFDKFKSIVFNIIPQEN